MVLVRIPAVVAFVAFSWVCMGAARAPGASQAANQAPEITDAGLIVRELCGKNVALLGESPLHGFGKALQFKVGLVRQLIDECHYNALFMESGIYDFLNIQKKSKSGQDVTESTIAAAIGGIWATREVQPLIPFLREKDRSMYLNFRWLLSRLPGHSKVIVWAATTHVAKDLSGVDGDGVQFRLVPTYGGTSRGAPSLLGSPHIREAMRWPVSPSGS
jgi:erythromycin esterase-like protein